MRPITLALAACLLSQFLMAGDVDTILVNSSVMKKKIPCVIIKPDSYKSSSNNYPVYTCFMVTAVIIVSGYLWLPVENKVDELQLIIVCPDGGFSSWYFDSPIDSTVRYETFVSQELTTYIDKNYHTIADRKDRAISGLSMGDMEDCI